MQILEKTIENFVVWWAKERGFLTPKVKFSEAGWPDRLFISPQGHTIFIEFKVPGEVPDKLQEYRLEQLRKRGITADWCDNTVAALVILKAALESAPVSGESYTADVVPISSGPAIGSRIGEDFYLSGSPKDLTLQKIGLKDSCHSPTSSNVQGVAGRGQEVGKLQQLDLLDSTLYSEGSNACE